MSENSKIEWTDATWNPVLGCDKVSSGCAGCYAVQSVWRMSHNPNASIQAANIGLVEKQSNGTLNWTGVVRCLPERLKVPVLWKQPKRIFVNSQSDLFHEDVPFEFIDQVFAVMAFCHQHTFQVLTKRPERMAMYLSADRPAAIDAAAMLLLDAGILHDSFHCLVQSHLPGGLDGWPLPNVWLGVSVEDQKTADERIPHLLKVPAAIRFLSCEPLLAPVSLRREWFYDGCSHECGCVLPLDADGFDCACDGPCCTDPWLERKPKIGWVIVGGESGPNARPMHPDWARDLQEECARAHVPYFFKQWGDLLPYEHTTPPFLRDQRGIEYDGHWLNIIDPETGDMGKGWHEDSLHYDCAWKRVGKKAAGRLLDGRTWDEYPCPAQREEAR